MRGGCWESSQLNVTNNEFDGFMKQYVQSESVYWSPYVCISTNNGFYFLSTTKAAEPLLVSFFFFWHYRCEDEGVTVKKWKPYFKSNWAALGIGGIYATIRGTFLSTFPCWLLQFANCQQNAIWLKALLHCKARHSLGWPSLGSRQGSKSLHWVVRLTWRLFFGNQRPGVPSGLTWCRRFDISKLQVTDWFPGPVVHAASNDCKRL